MTQYAGGVLLWKLCWWYFLSSQSLSKRTYRIDDSRWYLYKSRRVDVIKFRSILEWVCEVHQRPIVNYKQMKAIRLTITAQENNHYTILHQLALLSKIFVSIKISADNISLDKHKYTNYTKNQYYCQCTTLTLNFILLNVIFYIL